MIPTDSVPVVPIVIAIALYVFFASGLYKLGLRFGEDRAWWAWVPIFQIFYMLRLAQLSYWWGLGLLIPLVNIGVGIYAWIRIAARRGKPGWVGALMAVPGVNLIVFAYLAFSKP